MITSSTKLVVDFIEKGDTAMSDLRPTTRQRIINVIIVSAMIGYCLGGTVIFFLFEKMVLSLISFCFSILFCVRIHKRVSLLNESIEREVDGKWG